jgi:hypothetical protein
MLPIAVWARMHDNWLSAHASVKVQRFGGPIYSLGPLGGGDRLNL